ncbi:LytR/AlgR family response regulator transcription factor [Pseudoduganella plicata]|uniref:DNA-binding response regulator n=1 Tax=Pseudoduganella plicata TaxID=321984 RepID=A0A4P7BHN0_9BURK|nr:LytTR family DNA-binding domain-containing protein [Pseudoduganella plicata]QBQ38304.1 response regulator transcription factor [Pseudoduganella plicata]GGY81032.1 DNA-binding response regulator [Pseudoduganella plicata]
MQRQPTALIADDEPLLRDALARQLAEAWPELAIVARVRNGREAVAQCETLRPDICFLDVHMPGMSGVEAAARIGRRSHLVFVTAYDRYAVQAFAQGALDYLVKPVEPARLADTVARLKERHQPTGGAELDALLAQLADRLRAPAAPAPLNWLTAQVGAALRLIPVADIDYLRSDTKYTAVAWRGDDGQPAEALVRTPLKDLLAQLDAAHFVQVHRSVVVNLRAVSHVIRGENETASVHLKRRAESLPVSRNFLHVFRQM